MARLFEKSLQGALAASTRAAVQQVENLDRKILAQPNLAGTLEKIIGQYTLEVARLQPEGKKGKRRDEERVVDRHGIRQTVKLPFIDVAIPFKGDPTSFELAPSHSHVLFDKCRVENSALILTLPDDDGVNKAVDDFVNRVSENLDRLRSEVAAGLPQIREAVEATSKSRQETIKAEQQRDKGRGFPIE